MLLGAATHSFLAVSLSLCVTCDPKSKLVMDTGQAGRHSPYVTHGDTCVSAELRGEGGGGGEIQSKNRERGGGGVF